MSNVPLHKKGNTKVLKVSDGYDVTLYGHLIVQVRGNLIHMNTCGYSTATTKQRMNMVLALEGINIRVGSVKGRWYCGNNPFCHQLNTYYYGVHNNNLYCTINKDNK